MSKDREPNIYFTVIKCPKCGVNLGVGLDLNSDDNILNCENCGTETEITLER